jgi:hypothetical protein
MKPLEDRFPNLYHEPAPPPAPAKVAEPLKTTVPRKTPPTLGEVVREVCSAHGCNDNGLMSDLAASIAEFQKVPPSVATPPAKTAGVAPATALTPAQLKAKEEAETAAKAKAAKSGAKV